MNLSRFKLYRWWKGGKWGFLNGQWIQATKKDRLIFRVPNHYGCPTTAYCHFSYLGVEKREDYTRRKGRK